MKQSNYSRQFLIRLKASAVLCILLLPFAAFCQNALLTGIVKDAASKPLENITVTVETLDQTTVTDREGGFALRNLSAGNYVLTISAVGYVTERRTVTVPANIDITLQPRMAGLREVVVTARPRIVGSSSLIERSAIIHTQPTSLADVLQLIPGQLATNPNLGIAQQVNLRQIPSTTDAARANALGTQIVLDGVPLSNNANLQSNVTIINSGPSALPPFSSVAGRGTDLRQIPADNIENIEVVRGIPSSRFGDLTSGLIIVNTRIGAFRPEVRVRLNPNLAQAAIAAGIASKNGRNTVNLSGDMINAGEDMRDNFNRYTRAQAQVAWQKYWNRSKTFSTTNIVSGYKTLDALKQDPDDQQNQSRNYADEWGVKISSEGRWRSSAKEGFSFLYTAALTYSRQQGYFQNLVTRDLFPISTATGDTTQVGVYGKSEYLNQTSVDGRPLNTYARVETNFVRTFASLRNKFMLGAEWRMDVNKGDGRRFNLLTPPRQNYSVGERPRSYSSIPALHQLGYYLEDRISGKLGRQAFILQAGLRIDNTAPQGLFSSKYKTVVSPRINLAIETAKGFWLRGGYGIAAKAATLNYLYGGTRFFDLVSFNYFAINPAERLVVLTTRTIHLDDLNLAPYTSKKWEAGVDVNKGGWNVSISAFHETTTGAIGLNREVWPVTFPVYTARSFSPNAPPVLNPAPQRIDTFFASFDRPVNNRYIRNEGVEYSIDVPEIEALRTTFNITGAYIKTEGYDDGHFTDADRAVFNSVLPQRIGIYLSGNRVAATRFNSSVRLIHRIPQLNMFVTGLWQTVWVSTSQTQTLSPFPAAFINRRGEVIALGESEAKAPAYADLVRPIAEGFRVGFPPLHLYNIRLTKEWKKGYSFSFFASNFLNQRPSSRVATSTTTTTFVRRNEPLFFGAEFSVSF